MTADTITLYKLALSPDYKNVLDFGARPIDEVLTQMAGLSTHTYHGVYPINFNGLSSSVLLNEADFQFLETFNYLKAENETTFYYFFVTDIQTVSDIEGRKVTRLSLTLDIWTTYYSELYSDERQQFIQRRTLDGFRKVEDLEHGHYTTQAIDTEETTIATKPSIIQSINSLNDGTYSVIWQRCLVDEDFKFSKMWKKTTSGQWYTIPASPQAADSLDLNNENLFRFNRSYGTLSTIYIPYALINLKTREVTYPTFQIQGVTNSRNGRNYTSFGTIPAGGAVFTTAGGFNTHVVYSDLTFAFAADPRLGLDLYISGGSATLSVLDQSDYFIFAQKSYSTSSIFSWENLGFFVGYSSYTQYLANTDTTGRIDCDESVNIENINLEEIQASTGDLFRMGFEARYHYYPFNFLSLFSTNVKLNTIPAVDGGLSYRYTIKRSEALTSRLHFAPLYFANDTNFFNLRTEGSLVVSKDNATEYMRANGASFITQKAQSLYNGIMANTGNIKSQDTTAEGAPGGLGKSISSAVFSGATTVASFVDMVNAQNVYDIPSQNCVDSTLFLDDILVVQNQPRDVSESERAWKYLAFFGVNYSRYGTVTDRSRSNYDYIQTLGCELPFIPNAEAREVLQSIFNNGVYVWHCDTAYQPALLTFNKDFCNIPLTIYNDKKSQEAEAKK